MNDLLNAKHFGFLARLAMMRTDSDETLCGAACGPGHFWCSSTSTVQIMEICTLRTISEKRLLGFVLIFICHRQQEKAFWHLRSSSQLQWK